MSAQILLTVVFALQGGALRIDYRVENRSPTTIYLTNHAVRMIPGQGPVPDKGYAFVALDGGVAHIAKRQPKPPTDRFFTPRAHYVTPVGAGQTYTETLQLPLPLEEAIPYRETRSGSPGQVQAIDLTIGYIPATPTIEAARLKVAGQEVYLLRPDQERIARERLRVEPVAEELLRSPVQSLTIPIKRPR